jgi:hypothetical protein
MFLSSSSCFLISSLVFSVAYAAPVPENTPSASAYAIADSTFIVAQPPPNLDCVVMSNESVMQNGNIVSQIDVPTSCPKVIDKWLGTVSSNFTAFQCPNGSAITHVFGQSKNRIDALRFECSNGIKSDWFGNNGGGKPSDFGFKTTKLQNIDYRVDSTGALTGMVFNNWTTDMWFGNNQGNMSREGPDSMFCGSGALLVGSNELFCGDGVGSNKLSCRLGVGSGKSWHFLAPNNDVIQLILEKKC